MRTLLSTRLAAALAATALFTAGCSGDDKQVAEDPAGAGTSGSDTPSEPTAAPTVGTYPEFEPSDYTFQLTILCYCPGNAPIDVVVEDGEVVEAVYAAKGPGVRKGQEAPEYAWLTINDVIKAANDTDAFKVEVNWPDGQDYPSSVAVDQNEMMVDEEMTYSIKQVEVS